MEKQMKIPEGKSNLIVAKIVEKLKKSMETLCREPDAPLYIGHFC